VGELRDLVLNGLYDTVVGVSDGDYADARAEVNELVSVDILQNRAVCALDVNGEGCANASRNVL
jgi:hypothetical protein